MIEYCCNILKRKNPPKIKHACLFFLNFHLANEEVQPLSFLVPLTGVARNFDWEGPKMEKFCDVILVTFFDDDDATKMTS